MRAKPSDLKRLTETLASRAQAAYPRVRVDRRMVSSEIEVRLSSANNFVATDRDAVLMTNTQDIPFAERKMNVIEVFTGLSLRSLMRLLNEYVEWVDRRPIIRFSIFTPLGETPPGMHRLLKRFGFEQRGGTYQRWRQ